MTTLTNLGALRMVDFAAWRAQIRAALARYGRGACPEAAQELGVSVRTLRRWARELEIEPAQPRPHVAAKKKKKRGP